MWNAHASYPYFVRSYTAERRVRVKDVMECLLGVQ